MQAMTGGLGGGISRKGKQKGTSEAPKANGKALRRWGPGRRSHDRTVTVPNVRISSLFGHRRASSVDAVDQKRLDAWLARLGGPDFKGFEDRAKAVAEMRAVGTD